MNIALPQKLNLEKYRLFLSTISILGAMTILFSVITQLFLPSSLLKNISFSIIIIACLKLTFSNFKTHEDPFNSRKWVLFGSLCYQATFIINLIMPSPIEWLMSLSILLEYLAILCVIVFVLIELIGVEKHSGIVGLNADILMNLTGFVIIGFLGFANFIFHFVHAYTEPVIRCVAISIIILWFLVVSATLAIENPEDKKTNIIRLLMALAFELFYIFKTLTYLDLPHADAWMSLSRVAIVVSLVTLLAYTRCQALHHKSGAVRVKHNILNQPLYLGIGVLLCSIPLGLLWAYVRNDHTPFAALIIASMFAMSLLTFRLLMLLNLSIKQSQRFWLESRKDSITGLDNRRYLLEALSQPEIPPYLIAVFDLNDFKAINDLYGHTVGDQLLRKFGQTLQARANLFFGLNDIPPTVARLTGDEFAIVVHQHLQEDLFASQILNALPEWWQIEHHRIYVTCSIGISTKQELSIEQRLREADYAVQVASRSNRQIVPQSNLNYTSIGSRQQMRQHVQDAIRLNHVFIQLQPIYSLEEERLVSFEALVRLLINGQTVMPGHFMDVVHSDGLHKKITEMVICEVAKVHLTDPRIRININLPPELLAEEQSVKWLIDLFNKLNIDISRITLEILESESLDGKILCTQVQKLCDAGFKIALDDFGAGYSSLSRFAELPIDYIKIDRSLVQATARNDMAPIESAVTLAKKHNCITVAEGVETEIELDLMRKLGIDYIQGYLLGKPMNINEAVLLDSTSSYMTSLVKARLAKDPGSLEQLEQNNKTVELQIPTHE